MRTILLSLMLVGCTILPQKYDSTLYDHYVQAAYVLQQTVSECSDPDTIRRNIPVAIGVLDETLIYDKYRNEPKLMHATAIVRADLEQMVVAYSKSTPPSVAYCKFKLQISESSLEHILEAIGGKPQ